MSLSIDELVDKVVHEVAKVSGNKVGKREIRTAKIRIEQRINQLSLKTPDEYFKYYKDHRDSEFASLLSIFTVHYTFFFREMGHFNFLLDGGLQKIIEAKRARGDNHLKIWSVACSTGQEVYSLAMFLEVNLPNIAPDFTYEIFGSDIDAKSLKIAENGVYPYQQIKEVPKIYTKNNMRRGTGDIAQYIRFNEKVRSKVSFRPINLLDVKTDMSSKDLFDLVFCRNVFIYFEEEQIKSMSECLIKHLHPWGFYMIGVSENIGHLGLPVEGLGHSIYVHQGAKITPKKKSDKIKVFNIDDSNTVLSLLGKVFTPEDGFEIIGTASDGLDAIEKLKTLEPDVITLDIHMPNLDGIGFLTKRYPNDEVPTIVVSSISREGNEVGCKVFDLGAQDYVEKPTMQDLPLIKEELQHKVKMVDMLHKMKKTSNYLDLEKQNNPIVLPVNEVKRIIIASSYDTDRLEKVLKMMPAPQPPTVVFIDGNEAVCSSFAESMTKKNTGFRWSSSWAHNDLLANQFVVIPIDKEHLKNEWIVDERHSSLIALGPPSTKILNAIKEIGWVYFAEEIPNQVGKAKNQEYYDNAKNMVPLAGIVYESDRHLSGGEIRKAVAADTVGKESAVNDECHVVKHGELTVRDYQTNKSFVYLYSERPMEVTALWELEGDPVLETENWPYYLKEKANRKGLAPSHKIKAKIISSPTGVVELEKFLTEKDIEISSTYVPQYKGMGFRFIGGQLRVQAEKNPTGEKIQRFDATKFNKSKSKSAVSSQDNAKNGSGRLRRQVRVLVVDDSKTMRKLLVNQIELDKSMLVVGETGDPKEVEKLIEQTMPDVISMDIMLPETTGVELLRGYRNKYEVSTIMVTSLEKDEGDEVVEALSLGAFEYVKKPEIAEVDEFGKELRAKIILAAKAKSKRNSVKAKNVTWSKTFDKVLVIGGSTGGTEAVRSILGAMPPNVPPTIIAVHIPAAFSGPFAQQLNKTVPANVIEGYDGCVIEAGTCYVCPGSMRTELVSRGSSLVMKVEPPHPSDSFSPSVDALFKSSAQALGSKGIGVILTGMGKDGAQGLYSMKAAGAETIGQDENSCVVYGMPKAAAEAGSVNIVASLSDIPEKISKALQKIPKKISKAS